MQSLFVPVPFVAYFDLECLVRLLYRAFQVEESPYPAFLHFFGRSLAALSVAVEGNTIGSGR